MDDDRKYHDNKSPLKTYVSPRIPVKGDEFLRIASKVFDSTTDFDHMHEKGSEVLHTTHGGRREIVAKFWENDRGLDVVTIRAYRDGKSSGEIHFSFVGSQITRLLKFLDSIRSMPLRSREAFSFTDFDFDRLTLTEDQLRQVLRGNPELVAQIVRNELTVGDVQALAFRREQLKVFERLLSDAEFFQSEMKRQKVQRGEDVWQRYFEANKWIFGFGLSLVVLGPLQDRNLEQIVRGADLTGVGKRADAVLKTRGLISSLSFAEIKRHDTHLLEREPYRSGTFTPSGELVGAVAQSQATVHAALTSIRDRLAPVDKRGDPTGEVLYGIKPRSFVVAGRLSEFETEHGVNEQRYRSFELYRRSLKEPEIITFDELYHRAQYIVDHAADA